MTNNILIFLSFLQSVIGFTLMSSSVMLFKEPVKKRILIGLAIMILGISLLSYRLYTKVKNSVVEYAVFVIIFIQLTWFLICLKDRFYISLFNFLTFVNVYVSISYTSDYLSLYSKNSEFVGTHMVLRLLIYIVIIPLLYKYVRPRFRRLVDTLDKE